MKITVLSSGSKAGNCYCISDGASSLLLDAGIPIAKIQEGVGYRLSEISGVLITHRHKDHSKALCDLLEFGTDVYALPNVFESCKIRNHHRRHDLQNGISETGEIRYMVRVGSFIVVPFEVKHDVPNLAFYIRSVVTKETLLYFTDTYYLVPRFRELHYILAEANYDPDALNAAISAGYLPEFFKARLVKTHMSIDTLLELLQANDLSQIRQIYLLHLSDHNSREGEFKKKVQQITGAEVYVA